MNSIVPYQWIDAFNEHFLAGTPPKWAQQDRDEVHEVSVMTANGLVPARIRGGYFTDMEPQT